MLEKRAILAFGLPGSGKGTHVEKLRLALETYGQTCRVIGIGESLRTLSSESSPIIAEPLAEVMHNGDLVPEAFPLYVLVKEMLALPAADVFIVDGLGRQKSELRIALRMFRMIGYRVDAFLLDITADEARKRLLERGRADDTSEAIDRRIRAYRRDTKISLRCLRLEGVLSVIDGMGSIEETHQKLLQCLSL